MSRLERNSRHRPLCLHALAVMALGVGSPTACRPPVTPVPTPAATSAPSPKAPTQKDRRFSVMSFNIRFGTARDGDNHWDKRQALVMKVLRDHDPDIVGLQEALRFQLDAMQKAVPGYREIGVGRNDGKTEGEYAAILVRAKRFRVLDRGHFWFSDTPQVPCSKSWGNTICRMCTWAHLADRETGRMFYVYNLHLDHRSFESRKKSAAFLLECIRDREHADPVVVTGDFNSTPSMPPIRILLEKTKPTGNPPPPRPPMLIDVMDVLHPNAPKSESGTYHGWNGRSAARIDYIFASPDLTAQAGFIVRDNDDGRYPSDHFPIMVTLE